MHPIQDPMTIELLLSAGREMSPQHSRRAGSHRAVPRAAELHAAGPRYTDHVKDPSAAHVSDWLVTLRTLIYLI